MSKTTSKFADLDQKLAPLAQPLQCRLCLFLADAPNVDSRYVAALLADRSKGSAHIARVLTAGGVEITESSVKRHRANHLGK